MIEQIYTYFTLEMLYYWVNLGVLPFWLVLIFFPQSYFCRYFVTSIFPIFILSGVYIFILYKAYLNIYPFNNNLSLLVSHDSSISTLVLIPSVCTYTTASSPYRLLIISTPDRRSQRAIAVIAMPTPISP